MRNRYTASKSRGSSGKEAPVRCHCHFWKTRSPLCSFEAKNFVPLVLSPDSLSRNADDFANALAESMSRPASPHFSHPREKCAREMPTFVGGWPPPSFRPYWKPLPERLKQASICAARFSPLSRASKSAVQITGVAFLRKRKLRRRYVRKKAARKTSDWGNVNTKRRYVSPSQDIRNSPYC